MGFIGKLFGTEEALKQAVLGVKDGLDALVYTDEERAHDAANERREARSMIIGWMQATQGQNLARRLIALSITFVWLCDIVIGQALAVASLWVSDPDRFSESSKLLMGLANDLSGAIMLILGFYFAAPHMGDIAKSALLAFGRKNGKSE